MDVVEDEPLPVRPKVDPTSAVVNDWKRTKWQPPPSHHSLLPVKSKVVHKMSSRNQLLVSDRQNSTMEDDKDEGIVESEFTAIPDTFAHHFSKQNVSPSFEEIVDVLNTPIVQRADVMARADMCPIIRRPRLVTMKGVGSRIRDQYGYEISNTTYLYAEEALYLIEIGKLQLHLGNITLSVERARSLLLHSRLQPKAKSSKIKSCSVDEYLVYKHLSKLGYRLRRRDKHDIKLECLKDRVSPDSSASSVLVSEKVDKDVEMHVDSEEGMMDLDEEPVVESRPGYDYVPVTEPPLFSSPSSGLGHSASDSKRGVKRKFCEFSLSQHAGSTTPTSSAKDISDDEDADGEFDFVAPGGDANMDSVSESHTNPSGQPAEGYMVTEADSDVEFFEDVPSTSGGVQIEEIRYDDYDGDIEDDIATKAEPQPSTSSACFSAEGLVDLAKSDSDEEGEIKAFSKVWNKFVPNATIQIGFPPNALLPSNILYRDSIYEFDLKNRGERSDSELEYYVDELNLNSSPADSENEQESRRNKNKRIQCKSWKEWRQLTMEEAKDVLNDSLLAHPSNNVGEPCDDAMKKLYLWEDKEHETKQQEDWTKFSIPHELYPPGAGSNVHKNRLKTDFQPCYVVAVVRNSDLVPSFSTCEPVLNGIPVLVAVVSEETEILFMTPDRSPVPSLF